MEKEFFRCPYCGKKKDVIELNYNTELGNFEPTLEKFGNIRDAYDYKHINYKYTRYEVPICDDCLIIHQEAGSKGTIIALVLFLPIAFYLLCYVLKTGGGFWDFIIPTGLVGIVCLGIRLLIKIFLISRKGINYRSNYRSNFISDVNEPLTTEELIDSLLYGEQRPTDSWKMKLKEEEERRRKDFEEWERKQAEYDRAYKIVEVDMGCGKKGYIGVPRKHPIDNDYQEESEESLKRKKFEQGASIDYSDDDFEGHFV